MKRAYTLVCFLALVSSCRRDLPTQTSFALTGKIATASGIINDGTIIVADGLIKEMGTNVSVPTGIPLLRVDGIIFPGLIDLHNHLRWNVLPRWTLPAPVANRYEWQAMPDEAARLSGPEDRMMARGEGCDMERYAEIKALLGGATSVAGTFRTGRAYLGRNGCVKGLVRKLDVFSGLYSPRIASEPLRYEVFPLEMGWQQAQMIRDKLASHELKAVLFHVGEGKDESSRREFSTFRALGFLRPGASIIHGVALGTPEFREMAANGVGLIWSPRSNYELYGQTADVEAAKAAQVTIALAPDWSPTGSSGLLDELRYASKWNDGRAKPLFSNADFFEMVTSSPARLAALGDRIGSLAPGMAADLIVLPNKGDDPLQSLVRSSPATIELAVVGGHALLGTRHYMMQLNPGKELETIMICNHRIALNISEEAGGESFSVIEGRLRNGLQSLGTSLAPLSECN